jgi:putative ABC transport system permease protein
VGWLRRLRGTIIGSRAEEDLDDEIRFHLDERTDEYVRHGLTNEDARGAALRRFGNVALTKDRVRDTSTLAWLGDLARDIRRAARGLRRNPGFAVTAIASLALGIGANTALFTLADAVMLRPIGAHDPSRLIRISTAGPAGRFGSLLPAAVEEIQRADLFDGVCGFLTPNDTVEINDHTAPITGHMFTGGCFATLGIRPALGRLLTADDNRAGAPRVVVLSYDAWQNQFGGSASVLEQTVAIEGERYAVVGVVERRFTGLLVGFRSPLYWPLRDQIDTATGLSPASALPLEVFARLRPGMSVGEATAHLQAMWPRVREVTVPSRFAGVQRDRYLQSTLVVSDASTGIDYALRRQFEKPLLVLLAISGIVLLVSCVNIANLLMTRVAERRREALVRSALGASRWRLLQESLAESGLLLATGASAGLLLSYASTAFLVGLYGRMMPLLVGFAVDIAPDGRVLAFTLGVSTIAFVLFGAIPAWTGSRADASMLNAASNRIVGGASRLRKFAVVSQVALTIVLVAIGGLTVASLRELKNVPLGLRIDRLVGAQLVAVPRGYQNGFSGATYYRELLTRIQAIPGVEASALSQIMPVTSGSYPVRVKTADADREIDAEQALVSDNFFSTAQIPIVAGVTFGPNDTPHDVRTAIVGESTARALFGTASPIGQVIRVGTSPSNQHLQVVGIVRDVLLRGAHQQNLHTVYLNYWQADMMVQGYPSLVVRTSVDPSSIAEALDRTVRKGGHEYTFGIRTLIDVRDQSLAQERLLAILAATFAVLGLSLAAVGIYGLLSYSIVRRTGEIGIRMALGANRRQIAGLVLGNATRLVVMGALCGAPAAWAANKAVAALVYRRVSFGLLPATLAIVLLLLASVAGAWFPTRRATRVDPLSALRSE